VVKGPVLSIRDLTVEFATPGGALRAASQVSLEIGEGETIGLVGESGSGKTVTALSILRLLDEPPARIVSGQIHFRGQDLLTTSDPALRKIRGNRIAMVFQDPMTSLNPVYTVGEQIAEVLRLHERKDRRAARAGARSLLSKVGIPSPDERLDAYPHQLSGGLRQRVMIAMALACTPDLLIADEPTTALDVTVQAQILALLAQLQREMKMSVLLITHDLGVVAEACHRVYVMYAGQIVEQGQAMEVLRGPRHPYTAGLLRSVPRPGEARERLDEVPGMVPDLRALPRGCSFADRCARVADRCRAEPPSLFDLTGGRGARCFFPEEAPRG
jgi:oligopeptide/dipeptide ABC transporter ATP-binding protein